MKNQKPVVLLIMDGWGERQTAQYNAVRLAKTPHIDHLDQTASKTFLKASAAAVGLPDGQVGNSEVGHMTIGAGRIINQDLARINMAIQNNELQSLSLLESFASKVKATGGIVHLMALVSSGGVHSLDAHIIALAESLTSMGANVALHAFTDGRDTLPKLAAETLPHFADSLPEGAEIATICGRYYAMDRDNRWERTEAAYRAMTFAEAQCHADDVTMAIRQGYEAGLTDEFILPTIIGDYSGMKEGDSILMGNFRADRVRQILAAYCLDSAEFSTESAPSLNSFLGLVPYSDALDTKMDSLFPPVQIPNTLGEVVARAGLSQYRLAETEKYPHVTFFFNGGIETPYKNEERCLIPSPKVATYDLSPEMSAAGVESALCEAIHSSLYDLIIVNFANPDMVGHTGDLDAVIKAVEVVDKAVGNACEAITEAEGVMLVTSDHGNCEIMWDKDANSPHTAHSTNLVPLYLIGKNVSLMTDGGLSDLAPTLLDLLGLEKPIEMTGQSLIKKQSEVP